MRVALGVAVALLALVTVSEAAPSACRTGEAQGFAAIRWSPDGTVGAIPNKPSHKARWFWRRYNCTGRGVHVHRVDRGVYDIHFPGLGYRMALVSAISQEAVTASVYPFGTGVFRVTTRGPSVEQGLLIRRDIPFAIAVF